MTHRRRHLFHDAHNRARPLAKAGRSLPYTNFSDCYAKLNCTRPGGSPPFARLELNHALAKRGLVPTEVELTIQGNKYRSAHQVTWRLIGSDTARIDSIGDHISNYKEISFDTYRSNAGTSTTAASAASEKR